jgi:hypothetical protein
MKMLIKALSTFTAFDDGRMKVFNVGDEGEVTEKIAQDYIDAGKAEKARAKGGRRAAGADGTAKSDEDAGKAEKARAKGGRRAAGADGTAKSDEDAGNAGDGQGEGDDANAPPAD